MQGGVRGRANPGAPAGRRAPHARRSLGRPMDELRLHTGWERGTLPSDAPMVVCLAGLRVQGAVFNGEALAPVHAVSGMQCVGRGVGVGG